MGKKQKRTYEFGAREVVIEAPAFAKLLALNKLAYTNRKLVNGAFVWGFEDGHIVTTNCPLTGTYMNDTRTLMGVAGDIGVVGTKSFRDRVAKFLKRNAILDNYNAKQREFI
jgi:hypothetical protein